MIASIAQGLHLSRDERDHLFHLAGHQAPARGGSGTHISPGVLRILDRLTDTPAEVVTELGESLRQTPLGVALFGDLTHFTGGERSIGYRWFLRPGARDITPPEDHEFYSRLYTSGLRSVLAKRGPESSAARYVEELRKRSEEFRELWKEHEVGVRPREVKRYLHPSVGLFELSCQILHDPETSHALLVYTAPPASESYEKLQLLAVVGVV